MSNTRTSINCCCAHHLVTSKYTLERSFTSHSNFIFIITPSGNSRLADDGSASGLITDAGFAHLVGIHTLSMQSLHTVSDAAFVHLKGIHTLYMTDCRQSTITGQFMHLFLFPNHSNVI